MVLVGLIVVCFLLLILCVIVDRRIKLRNGVVVPKYSHQLGPAPERPAPSQPPKPEPATTLSNESISLLAKEIAKELASVLGSIPRTNPSSQEINGQIIDLSSFIKSSFEKPTDSAIVSEEITEDSTDQDSNKLRELLAQKKTTAKE